MLRPESPISDSIEQARSADVRAWTADTDGVLDVYDNELIAALATMDIQGAHALRQHQASAIAHALNNNHVFLSLATGAGKSLCFQIPALIQARCDHKVTVVIEPTLEIISSQIRALSKYDIDVEVFASTVRIGERDEVARRIHTDGYRPALIYTTAESFFGRYYGTVFTGLRAEGALARIVLDEAHTVLSWQDFRPPLVSTCHKSASLSS